MKTINTSSLVDPAGPIRWQFGFFVSLWLLFLLAGCEMYSDSPIRGEYQPTLLLHGILSPQEGGQVFISYTRPISPSGSGDIPDLPDLMVYLYEDGVKKGTFSAGEDGYFTLDKDTVALRTDRDYHVEAEDAAGEVLLKSGPDRFPPLPEIRQLRFYQDSVFFPEQNYIYVDLDWTWLPGSTLHFRKDYSIDGGETFKRGREEEYGRFSIAELYSGKDYPDGSVRDILKAATFQRPDPDASNEPINAVMLWIDHLSPNLSRFLTEVKDTYEAQDDPFATKNPVYSNIEGGAGIFGLYNSVVETIQLE